MEMKCVKTFWLIIASQDVTQHHSHFALANSSHWRCWNWRSRIFLQSWADLTKLFKMFQMLNTSSEPACTLERNKRASLRQGSDCSIAKVKSSSSILPDENSTSQHLKRSDLQVFLWYQCLQENIEYPSITDRGWENTEDGIKPVWFTCPQFLPSLSKKKSGKGNFKVSYSVAQLYFHHQWIHSE